MAVYDFPEYSFTSTAAQKRVITDIISLIDPADAPLINALGGLDGGSSKMRFTEGKNTLIEWIEDNLLAIDDTMNEPATLTSTVLTFKVTDGSLYEVGDIFQMDSEQIWVSAVSTNTLTTTKRGWFGTTSTTHDSVVAIKIVGQARLQGAESTTKGFAGPYTGSNWTQIYHQEVKVARTAKSMAQYGIADELAYQSDKMVMQLIRMVERDLFYNRSGNIATSTVAGKMKGLRALVTTNVASGASLTQAMFDSAVMSIYKAGGSSQLIAPVAPENMLKIKNFYDYYGTTAVPLFTVPQTETSIGMVIDNIRTPFGDVALLLDRWAPTTEICIIDPANAGMVTYYPFTQEPLAKTGDYERGSHR
jgi:frataxin-like iron-binding protein CyaY